MIKTMLQDLYTELHAIIHTINKTWFLLFLGVVSMFSGALILRAGWIAVFSLFLWIICLYHAVFKSLG